MEASAPNPVQLQSNWVQSNESTDHIDKEEFLKHYREVRPTAISEDNVKSGFKAAGLVSFNPNEVLDLLPPVVSTGGRTPSPPSSIDPEVSWDPATLKTNKQAETQASTIQKSFRKKAISTSSPTNIAFNKLLRYHQLTHHQMTVLTEEVIGLRASLNAANGRGNISKTRVFWELKTPQY